MVIVHGNKIPFYHYNVITYGNFKTSPWAQETAERLWLKDFSAELFLYLVVFFSSLKTSGVFLSLLYLFWFLLSLLHSTTYLTEGAVSVQQPVCTRPESQNDKNVAFLQDSRGFRHAAGECSPRLLVQAKQAVREQGRIILLET